MQKKILFIGLILMMSTTLQLKAQYAETDSPYKKWFVGRSLFLLSNLDKVDPPGFAQLNLGYRITGKDVISLKLLTWKHHWPLGMESTAEKPWHQPNANIENIIWESIRRYTYLIPQGEKENGFAVGLL